ncbi:hypothetical protein [Ornithinimicrobium kibberense]|uniref:hypothetical protein n=1 Tax=Ornithinimicrobium kibberense TaxID=282060 RepID=UPI003611F58B
MRTPRWSTCWGIPGSVSGAGSCGWPTGGCGCSPSSRSTRASSTDGWPRPRCGPTTTTCTPPPTCAPRCGGSTRPGPTWWTRPGRPCDWPRGCRWTRGCSAAGPPG